MDSLLLYLVHNNGSGAQTFSIGVLLLNRVYNLLQYFYGGAVVRSTLFSTFKRPMQWYKQFAN
jgi:hypothetical protein